MHKKVLAGIAIVLISLLLGCSREDETTGPVKKNIVLPIDVAGIETLLSTRDCPLMLVAMASWCAPCREELPVLQKMYEKYKDRGLRIIGISLDVGGPSAMQPLVDEMRLDFPIYWGGKEVIEKYKISAIPLTYVVKNGEVVEKILGGRDEQFLEDKIVSLLGECKK